MDGYELFDVDEPLPTKPTSSTQEEEHWYDHFDNKQPSTGLDPKSTSAPETKKQGHELFDVDDPLPTKSTSSTPEEVHWFDRFNNKQPPTGLDPKSTSAPETKKQDRPAEEKNNQQQQKPKDFTKIMEENVRTAIPEWSAPKPIICDVPEDLAEGNRGAYIPKVVCLGPLLDNKRGTSSMLRLERYKWRCVRKLIVRRLPVGTLDSAAWSEEHALLLRKCFGKMMSLVPQIRASYSSISSVTTGISSTNSASNFSSKDIISFDGGSSDEQLALNMLLDGCFILHRLLKYAGKAEKYSGIANIGGGDDDNDDWNQLFGRCWIWGTVKRDLLLLRNQVPFFVVRKLFKHLRSNDGVREDILVEGAFQLFSSLHPRRIQPAPIACHDVHHLLHLFYLSIDLPPPSPSQDDHNNPYALPSSERTWWVPCAKELDEAGVRFKPRKRGAKSFLDVRFCGGTLEIPPLQLFDYSVPLFRNLIAFEQTYTDTPGHFTAYAIFMDCLLKTTEDVRLLHRSGVLLNHMNGERDDTAMGFFSRLCAEAHTSPDRNYLAGVMEEVVKYQRARWPRWRAALVSNYFTNPWVTTSVIAAALVLAMTVLQSFYSVYGYYKPHK